MRLFDFLRFDDLCFFLSFDELVSGSPFDRRSFDLLPLAISSALLFGSPSPSRSPELLFFLSFLPPRLVDFNVFVVDDELILLSSPELLDLRWLFPFDGAFGGFPGFSFLCESFSDSSLVLAETIASVSREPTSIPSSKTFPSVSASSELDAFFLFFPVFFEPVNFVRFLAFLSSPSPLVSSEVDWSCPLSLTSNTLSASFPEFLCHATSSSGAFCLWSFVSSSIT